MKGKILCSCNTPLQLLNMVNIIENELPGYLVDVCITDKITNAQTLCENLRNSNHFNNVLFVKTDRFVKYGGFHNTFPSRVTATLFYKHKIKKFIPEFSYDYDYFLFGNFESFSNLISLNLPKAKLLWVEDGLASYRTQGMYWILKPRGIKAFFKHVFRIDYIYNHVYAQYLYRPDLAEFNIPFLRKQLPFLKNNPENIFSKIYGFSEEEEIKEKVIYFDMPFEKDGIPTNDKHILEIIANIVGKDNLIVKIHPRNSPQYYIENGYKIVKKTYIPWEVYCMSSTELNKKILISGWSGATISPYLYFNNKDVKSIILQDILDSTRFSEQCIEGLKHQKEHIFIPSNAFYIPQTEDELISILKDLIENGK